VPQKLDKVKNKCVQDKLFDFSCKINPKRTAIIVQRSIKRGWNKEIIVDGKITDNNVKIINEIEKKNESKILKNLTCHYVANFFEVFGDSKYKSETLKWIFK